MLLLVHLDVLHVVCFGRRWRTGEPSGWGASPGQMVAINSEVVWQAGTHTATSRRPSQVFIATLYPAIYTKYLISSFYPPNNFMGQFYGLLTSWEGGNLGVHSPWVNIAPPVSENVSKYCDHFTWFQLSNLSNSHVTFHMQPYFACLGSW